VIRVELTRTERDLLRDYFKTSSLKLVRLKAQAVLMKDQGLKTKDISGLLFKDARTIQRWLQGFSVRRMASIFSGHEHNENASKLSRKQKREISETLNKPPSAYSLPKAFWDVPSIKKYVRAEFGTVYESRQSYYFLLKFSNLSFKLPDKFDFRRNEHLISQRMKQIRAEIKDYLENKEWEVFTSDETRIQLEAITKRAWLKKGKKTIVKVQRSNEHQNYLGLLNQKSYHCHLYELSWQNQEEIIKALAKFLRHYGRKRICIVWDNARFHKGKLIRATLKKGRLLERVHLINFPPYAPDKNPTEHVWKETKQKISNRQFANFNETKLAFRRTVSQRRFSYAV